VRGAAVYVPTAGGAFALERAGDVDGDGVTDLVFQGVAGTSGQGYIRIAFIDSAGPGVAAQAFIPDGDGAWRLFDLADLDGDGGADLVLTGTDGSAAEGVLRFVLMNGRAAGPSAFYELRGDQLVAVADFDGDGREDLAVVTSFGPAALHPILAHPGLVFSWAGWGYPLTGLEIVGVGRNALTRVGYGPSLIAMRRTLPCAGCFEVFLYGWDMRPESRHWSLLYQSLIHGEAPVELLGLADVDGNTVADALLRFADESWVERSGEIVPIRSWPPFTLVSAGDIDGDGRWDLIYEGETGGPADGWLRIDRSDANGSPAERSWLPTGGGVWQLF
jgi:hypothetical protein